MTGEHFAELFDTVQMTTKLPKWKIARKLGVSMTTINHYWKKDGVPEQRMSRVRRIFRELVTGDIW